MLRVDDGRHGQNLLRRVVDDGIDGRVFDDVQVAGKVLVGLYDEGKAVAGKFASVAMVRAFPFESSRVEPSGRPYLVQLHELLCSILGILVEGRKLDVLWRPSLVRDFAFAVCIFR